MRIGIVLSRAPAYSETFFNSKIKGLQENGHDVKVFVQTHSKSNLPFQVLVAPKVYQSKITHFFVSIGNSFRLLMHFKNLKSFIKLEKQAQRSWIQIYKNAYTNAHLLTAQLDWVHFGFATFALNSEHVAKAIGAKMSVSLRGFDLDIYPLKHQDCYNLVWKEVDKVHTISNYLSHRACQLGLSKEKQIEKITPALDINRFKEKEEKKVSNKIEILTVARLHWIKGLTETLEALKILKNQGIHFNYTIIGDGKMYESLKFTIHQLQLTENVTLAGYMEHNEVATYLKNGDLYIQYSHSEGFCNAVLEAQATGLLCVVSDGGGLPENVIDNQTGWVVPKRQPKLLAQKINEIVNLPNEEKLKIRNQARIRIEKQFSLEQQKQAFEVFYIN